MPDWLALALRRLRRSRSSDSHDQLTPSSPLIPPPISGSETQEQTEQNIFDDSTILPASRITLSALSSKGNGRLRQFTSAVDNTATRRKKFSRGAPSERDKDVKRLALAFILQENQDLRAAITLVEGFRRHQNKNRKWIEDMAGMSATFLLELAELLDIAKIESLAAISEFLGALRRMDKSLKALAEEETTRNLLNETIATIKQNHASLFRNNSNSVKKRWDLGSLIDTPLLILEMLKDGCELAPVPYLKSAVGLTVGLLKALKQTCSNYDDMRRIADMAAEFVLSLAVLCSHDSIKLSENFKSSLAQFIGTLEAIVEKCEDSSRKSILYRFIQQGSEKDRVSELSLRLDQAIKLFQSETQILQQGDIQRIKEVLNVIDDKMDIDVVNTLPKHPYYGGHKHNYMPGSRDDVMGSIATWIEDPSLPILWLHGAAGMGKSTIAHQLDRSLTDAGRLATHFFFTSGSPHQSDPIAVIKTLARELASLHPQATHEIAKAARAPQSSHETLSAYLEQYIISPIKAIPTPQSAVIVLDALNEWANHLLFLEALQNIVNLLSGVKIIITSRREKQIEDALADMPVAKIALGKVDEMTMQKYFNQRFKTIVWNDRRPTQRQIERLANLADGLLVWAATACEYISNDMREEEPHHLLDQILSSMKEVSSEKQLTSLYQTALVHMFGDGPGPEADNFCRVFGAILVLQESLKFSDFEQLLKMKRRPVLAIHARLAALQIRGAFEVDVVTPASECFHASFLDYSIGQVVPSHLHISTKHAHSVIAQACLQTLAAFFGASGTRPAMKRHVRYAADYWVLHLAMALSEDDCPSAGLAQAIEQFVGHPLRSWVYMGLNSLGISEIETGLNDMNDAKLLHLFVKQHGDQMDDGGDSNLLKLIHIEKMAVYLAPDSTIKAKYVARLGTLYDNLFQATLMVTALDDAVNAYKKALELRLPPHPDRSMSLNNLALALQNRFDQTGSLKDILDAIDLHREELELCPPPHPDRLMALNNLGNAHQRLFEHRASLGDLNDAIVMSREALGLCPTRHPDRSVTLNNLASALQRRFGHSGSLEDLDEAITMHQEALSLCPAPHPDRSLSLNNLARALRTRYGQTSSKRDLNEAINMHREALSLRPSPHPDRISSLNNLAITLESRFDSDASLDDLNEAIILYLEGLDLCTPSHPSRLGLLNNLAGSLESRFIRTGCQADLHEAIAMHREALALGVSSSADQVMSLNNLGNTLMSQFRLTGSLDVLEEMIAMHREALDLRPSPHLDRLMSLNNLGQALLMSFQQSNLMSDLDESITLLREAVMLCSSTHSNRRRIVKNFADALRSRSEKTGSPEDLEEADSLLRTVH